MHDRGHALETSLSRRRLLALAGATAAMATAGPGSVAAGQETVATPTADTPGASPGSPEFPIPGTLAADASPRMKAASEVLIAAMRASLVPGAALGILVDGHEEHAAFGLASLSSMEPVLPETLFQIGSVSKTFTATAVWRLIDEGALELDSPVQAYLPELTLMDGSVAGQVTVGNLLDHSAGWYGDEGFDTGEHDDALARYITERLPQLPQVFAPGEYGSYNNAAFTVLGRLVEVATGTTYNAALRHLLLDPLGLDDSLLERDAIRQRPYADGHAALLVNGRVSVAVQTPLWVPRSVEPAGGIWSTTRDLLRYARFHMNRSALAGDVAIVQGESLAQMQEPAAAFPGLPVDMGRSWFVQHVDGIRVNFHGGDTLGQHADLLMIPEHNMAIAILTNGQGGGAAVTKAALDATLAEVPGLSSLEGKAGLIAALSVPPDAPLIDLPAAMAAEYVGRFADLGQSLTVSQSDAGLDVTFETLTQPGAYTAALNPVPAPAMPVSFVAKDEGVLAGGRLPFVRDADGRVAWVSTGLRLVPRVE